MTVAAAVQGTAIVVAMDMTGGIIDRFRTMAIARSAVLTGHVLASLDPDARQHRRRDRRRDRARIPSDGRPARLARRHRPADAVRVRAHLARDRARPRRQERRDRQQHTDVPHLPALSRQRLRAHSRRCRPGCGSSPTTSPSPRVTETLRGLLTGTPIGTNAVVAVAWSVGIALASYLWARHLYTHGARLDAGRWGELDHKETPACAGVSSFEVAGAGFEPATSGL